MTPIPWHFAVLIPARDEEDLVARCLSSVDGARLHLPPGVTSDVVLVSDSSTDSTVKVARRLLGDSGIVVEATIGHVGGARALAARVALERYAGPRERCWFANTDADCEVPGDWLINQLAIAAKGFAAVAGIVDVDSFTEHDPQVETRFRQAYLVHSDGTHPHVHGANIGVRADAYLSAGGWKNLATAEDHDLWNRLKDVGHDRFSDGSVQVMTSGRRRGRAPLGFAAALDAHNGLAL